VSTVAIPPRPWTWALDPEEIDVDGGGVAVLRDADGVEFLRATTEHADEIHVIEHIVAAVNEVEQWRKGGVTEDLLRRHDGSIHLGRGCSVVRTEEVHASGEPEAGYPPMQIREAEPLRYVPLSAEEAAAQEGGA